MEGLPEYAQPSSLWPSIGHENRGEVPHIPDGAPWLLLDKENPQGLSSQLTELLLGLGSNLPPNLEPSVSIDESAGPVFVDDSASVGPSVHLEGPSYIGPNSEVRHGALVRGGTWACDGAVIGHACETKHSLLLPGAKAPHFNYVGDSILGSKVNLGAGVKLSNLRHDGREVTLLLGGERRGTGLRKFGAILGEGCQLGCNAVTNPGVILGKAVMVAPNALVSGVHPEGAFLS